MWVDYRFFGLCFALFRDFLLFAGEIDRALLFSSEIDREHHEGSDARNYEQQTLQNFTTRHESHVFAN